MTGAVLVADETRRSGGVGEGVVTALVDAGFTGRIARVTSEDSFVPLGDAARTVLLSEAHDRGGGTRPAEPIPLTAAARPVTSLRLLAVAPRPAAAALHGRAGRGHGGSARWPVEQRHPHRRPLDQQLGVLLELHALAAATACR